jgi:hypothetical protein
MNAQGTTIKSFPDKSGMFNFPLRMFSREQKYAKT